MMWDAELTCLAAGLPAAVAGLLLVVAEDVLAPAAAAGAVAGAETPADLPALPTTSAFSQQSLICEGLVTACGISYRTTPIPTQQQQESNHGHTVLRTLWMSWLNCYHTATACELIWMCCNVTGRRFSNCYESGQSQAPYWTALALCQWHDWSVLIPSKHADFLLPVETHTCVSHLLRHTASSASTW